jgi:nucleoside-diphosphate-sugar epimerase
MKILVTGSTGFIGSYIIENLLAHGHEIIATSSNKEKASKYSWYYNVTYIEHNIEGQSKEINLFENFGQPDLVIHLAWQGLPNYNDFIHVEKNLFPQYYFLKNLIDNGLKKLVATGTCLEYGLQNGCLSENMPTLPSNPYAVAKDSLRRLLEILTAKNDVDFKWVRLFYMYGKGQAPTSLFSQLEKAIENGDEIFNMSGGEQLRDYLPVETVVDYLIKIALQDKRSGVFNCSGNAPVSVRNMVETYLKEKGSDIKLNFGYYSYPQYEPLAFWGDNSKLKQII